ncbi:hypothetical protein L3X38_018667 [Prunus dulcis]|uniref:Uncharacterized protein n=1 Tax=Prunus dulcis TaxID=3755 RepID=A0AAD4W9G6_PRUDU|nr:hypothetical protein L3X38_018667 [Prunus dulcis]
MLGSSTKIGEPAVEFASKNTALVSRPTGSGSSVVPPRRLTSTKKDKLKCDHCGEKRHTIDTCWVLHGVPDWEKERRRLKKEQLDSKAHVAVRPTSVADITTRHDRFTTTPPLTLAVVSSTPTLLPPGNFGKAFHAHDTCDIGWIINSGATYHMTYNSALFSTTLSPHRDHILTANNATAPVTKASSILLIPTLPLDKVLLVPSLSSNLLSVSQVTEQLNRVVCAGSAETSQHRRIWLLHCRFGYVSFGYLRQLFPALFRVVNKSAFQCQTAKNHRGVLHETICSQTPQQNGVAKRKNGQILAATLALLLGASVLKRFWMDVVTYAIYLLNRLLSRVLDFQTPMQASSMLTLSPKVFCCVVYVHLHQNQMSKLNPCVLRCVFLGFSPHQKGY